MGFGVQGWDSRLGFRVQGLGFRVGVWGLGEVGVWDYWGGLGFRVRAVPAGGLEGFRIEASRVP